MAATKRRPNRFLPAAFLFLLIIFYLCLSQTPNSATEIPRTKPYQYNPLSWQTRVENYNHRVLPAEAACQNGTLPRHADPALTPTVPRVVHFTWGLQGDGAFTFALYLAVRAAQASIRPHAIRIHYTRLDRANPWFRRLEPHLTLVHHAPEQYLGAAGLEGDNAHSWHVAHVADVLRLQVLRDEGGIYLDADAYAVGRGWDGVLAGARDVVLGHEGGNRYGMANAVIVAKRGARFVERWLGAYGAGGFDERDWNGHSVVLPKRLSERFPEEVCGLSPRAFFWPLWTERHVEWMHEPLGEEEARGVEEQVRRNGGALYEDQLVYHAWSQNSFGKYVERLTPEIIESEDTRFNILMRRFLPDR